MRRPLRQTIKRGAVRLLRSYDRPALAAALERLGIGAGDWLMVHSSWNANSGFQGRPADMIGAIKDLVTPTGLVSMPSLTYQNESSRAFLAHGGEMNVRRSPSKMGLLTEVFRRGRDVHRSLSPTHPVLAWGEAAEEFVRGHESCAVPFGRGSPFARLHERDGRVLALDAPFSTITFTHFVEDRIAEALPVPLYEPEPMTGTVVDRDGNRHAVPVMVISDAANAGRREERYVAALESDGVLRRSRVGNTSLLLASCREMVDCAERMIARGDGFFEAGGAHDPDRREARP